MQKRQLTENGLVSELKKSGAVGISKRKIAEWRKEALLPDFDIRGRGRGKGLGKTESIWKHSDAVIEQAKWLHRIRAVKIPPEDFHLNLWMLGYSIHPEDVRDSLLEPLAGHIKMLALEVKKLRQKWQLHGRTDGIFEDVINDGTTTAFASREITKLDLLIMPLEVFEALANIFLNPEFNTNFSNLDIAFTDLEGWSEVARKFSSELFEEMGEGSKDDEKHTESLLFLLHNASFIQRYFSLHQVEKAVRECTEEDLAEVQADLRILTKIAVTLARTFEAVLPYINPAADFFFDTDAFLPILFKFAEYFVLADVSLRRSGYAQTINQLRERVLDTIEEEFSETVRKNLEQAMPVIGQPLSRTFKTVERKFSEF